MLQAPTYDYIHHLMQLSFKPVKKEEISNYVVSYNYLYN